MEKSITSIQSRWLGLLAVLLMFVCGLDVSAQNVTIRGNNGSTVAAVKNGGANDTFFNVGGFATWQHEQLAMVLTTSDGTNLTPNGQLDNPANNLFVNGEHMQIAHGQVNNANVCYVSLSLPQGYRFTGYEIKFTKPGNVNKGRFNDQNVIFNSTNVSSTFGETGSDFGNWVSGTPQDTTHASITTNGRAVTIKRNEGVTEMSNVLYFKLELPDDSRTLIQLESAEFWFTSEENYSPVTPAGVIKTPVSAVDVPFSTSKVDFGEIESRTYNGATRISYSSANVHDLEGMLHLYEEESVEDGTDIDGVPGKVIKKDDGTISSAGGFFKLGRTDKEQVYYIESPNHVEVSNGNKVPVGYRIVGAEFEYTKSVKDVATRTFYISFTDEGTTYYLNSNGRFTTTQTTWEMDHDGYISTGSGSSKSYLYFNNGYASTQSQKPASSECFGISHTNEIYQLDYPLYHICYLDVETQTWGRTYHTRYGLISKDSGQRATYNQISTTTEEATVGNFTLYIYDKEGKNPVEIPVSEAGTYTLEGLNNDAVKFGVKGIGLVRATLTMQALDPYLQSMNVICQDQVQTAIRMSQEFTASDFSVSGGEFYFYLPADCAGHQVQVTFEDLFSKYFDDTYPTRDPKYPIGNSRINFVRSDHYDAFGTSHNTVYSNISEAQDAQEERLKVGTVGTAKFKFNNADVVGTSGGTLQEYAFSLENYEAEGGSFDEMFYTVSNSDQVQTRYVFTCDETRYNIAPTTALQHRAYAFYEMIVHVQSGLYEPKVRFVPIYKDALYGNDKTGDFYGAVITAYDGNNKPGYSSTEEIFKMIDRCINTDKVDDFGNTDIPKSAKNILYYDFSSLKGVYQVTTEEHGSMEDYYKTGSPNSLIFIPKGHGAPNDNVAYQTEAGSFRMAHNLVLTDKYPFYSPYNIQLEDAAVASYTREVTVDKNGKVSMGTLVMPFVVGVNNGVHDNGDGTSFSLHQIKANDALLLDVDNETYSAYAPALDDVIATTANTPYIVKVINAGEVADTVSFTVKQRGSTIVATTPATSGMAADYTFTGAQSQGVDVEAAQKYTFTPKGTYAGKAIDKSKGHYYYFAKDMFLCSDQLTKPTLKVLPFRAYLEATNGSNAKYLGGFDVIFEDGLGDTDATGIKAVDSETITSFDGPIYNLAGQRVATPTQGGIYIVNGKKLIVK